MTGYKAFDENLQCRGFQFEVGKTYETGKPKEELKLCSDTVFHFCRELYKIESVSNYTISKSRVCEVIAEGDIVTDGNKYCTNRLTILREIPREELNEYNNRNSGNRNSGNWNSGNCNSGNCNSGDWNSGDWNSGYFNSDEPNVRMFNKNTRFKRDDIHIPSWCYFDLTMWVSYDTATEQEKETHKKEIEVCGGFLKTLKYKEAWRLAWDKADKKEHKQLLDLPNWDNEVFKKITGIDAEKEIENEAD